VEGYSRNLRLLNALIAMCRPDPRWPHFFYDLMYGVKWIEQPFTCETGESLKPDLVIYSPSMNNCILFEIKGGSNIDNDQAIRYKSVRPRDVVSKLLVDVINGKEPSIDVSYMCFSDATTSITQQLKAISADFPIFELGMNHFRLVCNKCTVEKINIDLSQGIAVDSTRIPMGYVHFDADSSDSEVAPFVMQTLVAFASQNRPHFQIEEITEDAVGSLWPHFSMELRKALRIKVSSILGEARTRELKRFLAHSKGLWTLNYSFPQSTSFPTKRLESLRKRCKQFVKRLRDEERSEGYQAPLFVLD
jgi:hypothetical protein